jgi:anhydro-N-acetylmuramic acid kinase
MRVLGLLSGTSMDGIDVAVGDFDRVGAEIRLRPVRHASLDYPAALRTALHDALPPNGCTAERLCRLDTEVGQAFAAAAVEHAEGADLVASLGQTVYHWVEGPRCLGTLQLGRAAWIAEATGLPVVSDLRARDVAAGGHGAPLAPVLDRLLLGTPDVPTAALNLGGIANITVLLPHGPSVAFDTGPANALLDAAARATTGADQDTGGALAARGRVRDDLLAVLRADTYYAASPPKSTGKEHFNGAYLGEALGRLPVVAEADLLATLVALTATTVADACRGFGVRRVVASGGGVRNPVLMAALADALAPAELTTTDGLGIPADAKEAYLAALLGYLAWHGTAVDPGTGGAGPRVHGSLTPGAGPLRLPEPAARATALRITVPELAGGPRARA